MSSLDVVLADLRILYADRYVAASDLADFLASHPIPDSVKLHCLRRAFFSLLRFDFRNFRRYRMLNRFLHHRDQLNQQFLRTKKHQKYQIEGNYLDSDQITAVYANEDAELILASAGSGKTATLLAKVDYLIHHVHVDPTHILLITFTRKVVAELQDRISEKDVEIRTFHSLGHKIIQAEYPHLALMNDQDLPELIHRLVTNYARAHPAYHEAFQDFLTTGGLAKSTTSFIQSHHTTDARDLELLFLSILNLQKSKNYSLPELRTAISQIIHSESRTVAEKLYHLYAPIYQLYIDYLDKHHLYDFSDMLNLATHIVQQKPPHSFDYEYILVDEAQDLSDSKCQLLAAVLAKCTKVKLFAVGDDWQSIYRFAGSNLSVLQAFAQTFQRTTFHGVIHATYRFGQPTARISNRFITRNPCQSQKHVRPAVRKSTPIYVKLNTNPKHSPHQNSPPDYQTLVDELERLSQTLGERIFQKKIQIISRYNRDAYRLVDAKTHHYGSLTFEPEESVFTWQYKNNTLTLPYCTMHRAKGITRDIVFVLNLNSGELGMPATRPDNPLMATMLSRPDNYPYAEERRLFYVAITRARECTILIADYHHISDFVYEISPRLNGAGVKVCPKCHHGIMELRHSRRGGQSYHACSHCHCRRD